MCVFDFKNIIVWRNIMNGKSKITVVGSANYDMIAYVGRLPKIGETIHGDKFQMGFGGKGANQAVTAAKLNADVAMIAKLGNDIFGKQTLENFKNTNVDTEYVYFTDKASSGVAPISVDKSGHNSIIVIAGANNLLAENEIESAREKIAASQYVVCQLEIPLETTIKAMRIAREEGVKTIFNPAPAPENGLPDEIYKLSDIFCPNETEAELLTGITVNSIDDAERAARVLLKRGANKVIMTLGGNGCLLVNKDLCKHIPGYKVNASDTTGAGDCFIGSFTVFSSLGFADEDAIKKANYVASISVQHEGTQTSYPLKNELPEELFK
jgi:ribokinase